MGSGVWPPWPIKSLEQKLDQLASAVQQSEGRDDDDQMWLTRFLVVRTCGYLEQVVHETVTGYINLATGGTVRSFSLSWLTRSRNPSADNLLDIVGRFDLSWRTELQVLLDKDDGHLNRELSLLVQRRHQIAHGLNEGLNARKAVALVDTAKMVADWFIRQFNPDVQEKRRTGTRI